MKIAIALALLALGDDPLEKDFAKLHAIIKPQGAEFAWYDDVPWLLSVQEAREKAAAQGKPIVVWCSADGQPCGAT